ncbi:hypothetical protein C7212DRAFT_359603 [Tuber magnatum]|uniref:Carrier domain-containing protein n=1 Tax=Tuber magnatum TaxID=42249 RepID=A0A317SIX9_9PEZI|nr:hypothetical protein C7212DRAFT_359603 [Tuber magnatum]
MHRYTTFPNLCIAAAPTPDPELPTHNLAELRIPSNISKKSILFSWSQILRGYVPGDSVVFRVGDEVVNVDFMTGSVKYIPEKSVQVGEEEGALQGCTGVYFQNVEVAPLPNVYLVAVVPLQHLHSLASQLLRQLAECSVNSQSTEAFAAPGNGSSVSFGELSVLNPHPRKLAGPGLLHELISPAYLDHKALDFMYADGEVRKYHTYEQLDTLSTQFAFRLLDYLPHGKTGHAIPVLLPQSPELYIALIGILKAGAAFVPLNLDAPMERIRFVVGDVRASVIVTESSFCGVFTWEGCPPTVLAGGDITTAPGELRLPSGIDPNGPAYIMYTSGSTGTPKGVIISHSAATQSLLAHEEHIPLFERFLQFAAPTFDVFVFEMFFPLFRGKTLVGCDRGRLLADLPGVINRLNIDGAELTPTVAGGLLIERNKVPGLKVLLTIGEMLTRQVVNQFGGSVLQGMYGPTEAAIHCTLATGFEKSWKIGDIGVPFKTVSAFVLSTTAPDPEVLPLGWAGELAIGGYQLADGYLNRPELTKEVFTDLKEYGRLYRTGDRARMLSSGRIECLGRVGAGQVKLRGQRIELGEIEEVVLRTPGVKGAVASVLEDRLVVYAGGGVGRKAVYDVCRKWLPRFMVPSDLAVFDVLPRLPSGKVDRKGLDMQYLETSQAPATGNGAEELNDMERIVFDGVEELLDHKPSKQGSLIAVGLDSIQAIRLVSVLRSQGFTIEVVDVLRADCIVGTTRRTGFVTAGDGFAQVVWQSSRTGQFSLADEVRSSWEVSSLEQLIEPPFAASLVESIGVWQLSIHLHHAVYDGWCWEQVLYDFSFHLSGGVRLPIRPQYRDIVQYEILRSRESKEVSQGVWKGLLDGAPNSRLPNFHGHTAAPPGVFTEMIGLRISRSEYEASARKMRVSPQALVQTAWGYLLSLCMGSPDVVFGTVISGRTMALPGIEDILGPTILTLPLRVKIGQETTTGDIVQDVHRRNRLVLEHSGLPLREIRKVCGIEGAQFDSLLVWQQTLKMGGDPELVRQFPLLLEIEPSREAIQIRATYQHAVLPHSQVKLFLRQLDQLVSGIVSQPASKLSNLLDSLSEDILAIENPYPKPAADPKTASLAELVELSSVMRPRAIALDFARSIANGTSDSTRLTYAELNTHANKLAHHLIALGAIANELVCVCMKKSPKIYITILAILKAGAGYLPLTPETPKQRMRQILENANNSLVIPVDTTDVDEYTDNNPGTVRSGDTLAYAIFTSGSTGVPKGVLITNANIVDNLLVLKELYPTNERSRLLQFCSVGFDVSVFEIFYAWAMGICLCSGTKDVLLRDIEGAINTMGITHLSMTPTVAALISRKNVPGVEFLVTAGEALTRKVYNDWAGKGLFQGYGPSETVNICTVRPNVREIDHINNIGAPLTNTSAFVVADSEAKFRVLPLGGIGELCFGGAQVGRGYLNMPELTSRKFISHPKYGRVYRSGDTGRMLPDGSLEFIGRQDGQVKIRGQRIELGEIASVLLLSKDVIDAAATLVRRGPQDTYQLVAFIVPRGLESSEFLVIQNSEGAKKLVAELFRSVTSFLPQYMVPPAIIPLTSLPMTAQGKIDTKLLQSTYFGLDSDVVGDYMLESSSGVGGQEWTALEHEVADAIAEVARVTPDEVGRATSMFRLGLDSISVIQLSTLLAKAGHIRLDVSQIMRNPSASSIAIKMILPCTPLQEAMLSQNGDADRTLGQTAWARLLSMYTGETEVCFGNVVSGRTIPVEGVEDVIAPCFNTVPIRVQVSPDLTNWDVINRLQLVNAELLPGCSTLYLFFNMLISYLIWKNYVELVPSRKTDTLEIVLHFRRDILLEEHADVLVRQLNCAIISSLSRPSNSATDFMSFGQDFLSYANSLPVNIYDERSPGLLHSEFERHAEESSTCNALEYLNKDDEVTTWTFGELNQAANRVAHYLISKGVKRDDAVPLCLEKSPMFYICVLGVLKAGSAFTPIDPSLPEQRKQFMIEELELVDIASEDLSSWPNSNPVIEDLKENCLAYRIYTSGSTGKPKAVSLEIGSAVHTLHASKSIVPWREGSRLLQFAATTFDMCYYDCFMAWTYGFTLCSADKSRLLGDLEGTIKRMGATMLDLTPTVASTLHAENLPAVELLYCIGEAMPQNLVSDWDGRCANSYGPTEAAMCCTIVPTNRRIKPSNIGKPFDTVSFHVLTKDGRSMVPIFGSGELCIGGPQVAREYHNNPELTTDRFINFEGSRVYRTGDLVRQLGDGNFIFIGRTDDQVKIRGLRVELDEINSVLRGAHDRVRDVTTIVMKHSDDSKEQLVSFLALEDRKQHGTGASILKDDPQLDGIMAASRHVAIAKLPRYMIPGVILVIDHIPLSAAGKIDKRSLATLFKGEDIQSLTSRLVDADRGTEWTEVETKIREAFSKISRVPVEQVLRPSTIYEIGLDSISASQVAMELRKAGLQVSVIDILERPSIALLSPNLKSITGVSTAKDMSDELLSGFSARFMDQVCVETGLPKEKIVGVYPCTPVQEGMLSQFLRSKGELYFNHTVFELPENIDLSKLRDSWYVLITGQKGEKASIALRNLHLPSWGITLLEKSSGNHLLMLSAHHALYDAHSLTVILHSVARQYSSKDYSLPHTFYRALSEILKHTTDNKIIYDDQEFWKKHLDGCTISRFPNLSPLKVKSTTNHVSSVDANWSLSNIEKACRQLGISVHAAGQAAWARILSAYSGETTVTMGVVISGRSGISDAEDLAFPCIATLPSLCVLTGSNRELALNIQNSNSQMLKHQHTPLRSIQKWLGHAEQSLFDTIFVYQKGEARQGQVDLTWKAVQEDAFADYSISLELEPTTGDSLLIRATCKDNIIPREQSRLLLRQFQAALIDILESPGSLSTDFYRFPKEILSCTPAKEDEIPTDTHLLHKFVEKHRQLVPDKVAYDGKLDAKIASMQSSVIIKTSSIETPEIPDLKPSDLCYCLYTSGTTGTPKGCELTHENAVQAMLAFQRLFSPHWDSESRFLQFASFHFDVSVLEQFWSWSVGVCVTSAPRDLIFQDLALTIRELRITHLDLTPSLATLIKPGDAPLLCKGVFITGGEQLKQEILDAWGEKGCIYNGYGPTEVTIGCTMYPRVPASGKPSNIGPQFDNVGSFVLAPRTDKPVLRGAIGELCVSGKLVGRGYLNRPLLTEEKFPYIESLGTRIYRTGDLVRIYHDGTFDFAGRADDQVKLRGQRLEIGEINETLKQATTRARAVATLVLRHPKQRKDQLVSFIELENGGPINHSDIKVLDDPKQYSQVITILTDACRRKLPVYMVPTHFLPVSAIPLSVNNKVDNKRLMGLYHETSLETLQRISKREDEDGTWSEVEERLRILLADLTALKVSNIKRSSTIFELGLDSRAGFVAASVSIIMQYPVLTRLASELSRGDVSSSQDFSIAESVKQNMSAFVNKNTFEVCDQLALDPSDVESIAPCTALQEGMIARFLGSEKPLYYNSFPMVICSPNDIDRIRKAWIQVIHSTGVLRTCFCETPDGYAQVVLKNPETQWEKISTPDNTVQNTVQDKVAKYADSNRDLHKVPLFLLVVETPERTLLVLNIFHALYDGNSLPLILADVQMAYHGQYEPRPHQFADILGHLLSVDTAKARTFWEKTLAGTTPHGFPEATGVPDDGDHMVQLASKTSIASVETICKRIGCTPQAVYQAAWASVLSGYIGLRPVFGIVVSGRSIPLENIEQTIGPLFNTIPSTLNLENALSWEELIKEAHNFYSESIPYHQTPLRLVNKWMRATAEKPLFDTLFVYQKDEATNSDSSALWELMDSAASADYPLALEVEQSHSNGVKFSLVSKGSLMTREMSLGLLERLDGQLRCISDNPACKPSVVFAPEKQPTPNVANLDNSPNRDHASWGIEASILRQTIAALAEVYESDITMDSSIFELGLDSVEAIKLSSRLRRYGMKLSVSNIMRNPTIRKLELFLARSSAQPEGLAREELLPKFTERIRKVWNSQRHDDIEAIYPTTPLQEAMIAETLASDYRLYFNHDVLKIEDWVNTDNLRRAWTAVVERAEILRTSFFNASELFPESPCTFGQLVHKQSKFQWSEVTTANNNDLHATFKKVMQEATDEVDILRGPPFRVTIVHSDKARHFILSISHALYDGWSIALLHEDVRKAYHGSLTQRPSCRLLLENVYGEDQKLAERFWNQILAGASPSSLRVLSTETEKTKTYRREQNSSMPFSAIQSFCKHTGVTIQSLGQMCWALFLAYRLGEPDVMFGTILSGRDFDSADEIMFPAMNTVPVRAIIHGTYKEMLQYMQDNSANIIKYQHTPLRKIQKLAGSNGQRLFDTLFIYQRGRKGSVDKQKALWRSVGSTSDVEYNACVEMERDGDNLRWRIACKSTVFRLHDTQSLLQMLDSLLVDIVSHTNQPCITYRETGLAFGNLPISTADSSSQTKTLNGVRVDLGRKAREWTSLEKTFREVLAKVSNTPEGEIGRTQTIFHLGLDSISAISLSSELRKNSIFLSVAEILSAATIERMAASARAMSSQEPLNPLDSRSIISKACENVEYINVPESVNNHGVEFSMPATPGQHYMISSWINSGYKLFMPTFSFKCRRVEPSCVLSGWEALVRQEPILQTFIFITIHHALYDGVSLPRLIAKFQGFLNTSIDQLLTPDPEGPDFVDTVAFIQSQDLGHQRSFWTRYLSESSSTCTPGKTHFTAPPGKRVALLQPRALSNVTKLERECRQHVIFGIYLSNRHLPVTNLESLAAPTLNIVPIRVSSPGSKSTIKVARQIQGDLMTIGDPENSVVSLWRIREWTGIRVDCFFNFLKLPGSPTWSSNDDGAVNGTDKITLEEFTPDNVELAARPGAHFEGNASMKDIKTNFDIEVAVRGDQVDVGVFSTTRYLGEEDAQKTILWMCDIVEGEWGSE